MGHHYTKPLPADIGYQIHWTWLRVSNTSLLLQVSNHPSYLPPSEPSFTSFAGVVPKTNHPNVISSGPSEEFNFNKLVDVPKKYIPRFQSYHKTYDYNLMEKPHYETHERHAGYGYGLDGGWKKILKLLATFIPVGLLISALTPTVITVTNVNDTTDPMNMPDMPAINRYRSVDDSRKEIHNHILSSLDYFDKLNENGCEYRVFCELLVSASHMPDSKQQVQNLLDNFAKQDIDYKSRADDLKKVFEAVRRHDCNSVDCALIKNPP